MKNILIAGAIEKSDLVLYVAKIITNLEQKVLVVDATGTNAYKSMLVQEQDSLFVEIAGIDVAVQQHNISDLKNLLSAHEEKIEDYDIVLIDIDQESNIIGWPDFDGHVLVTSYEKHCITNNRELISAYINTQDEAHHVEFHLVLHHVDTVIDKDYIEQQFIPYRIVFHEDNFYIPYDEVDYAQKIEFQYSQRFYLKRLSRAYKKTLQYLVEDILDMKGREIKHAIK